MPFEEKALRARGALYAKYAKHQALVPFLFNSPRQSV
jgi:hypothetical protein